MKTILTINHFLPETDVATSWLPCVHMHANYGRFGGSGSVLVARRLR